MRRTVKCAVLVQQEKWERELGRALTEGEVRVLTWRVEQSPEFATRLANRRRFKIRKKVWATVTADDIFRACEVAEHGARMFEPQERAA
jgi:hypothetical protein